MVKFSQGNEAIDRIAYKLRDMLESDAAKTYGGVNDTAVEKTRTVHESNQGAEKEMEHVDNSLDPDFWDIKGKIMAFSLLRRAILIFSSYPKVDQCSGTRSSIRTN